MTRQKKSRKIGQIGTRKQEARPTDTTSPRRRKAPKGQRSGNRNSLIDLETTKVSSDGNGVKKDPKLGSKKKIELVKSQDKPVQPKPEIKHSDAKPQVKLKKVTAQEITPEQELETLETDERLIALAERVEDGELLTGKDAKYFNQKMNRYDELIEQLGLEEGDDDADPFSQLDAEQWDDLIDDKD